MYSIGNWRSPFISLYEASFKTCYISDSSFMILEEKKDAIQF